MFLAVCSFVSRFAIPIIAGFAVVSIISASYVGLNGHHVWRQSDSYSQILGMLGQPGLGPLDLFAGGRMIYDIPIYQMIVAGLSMITDGEPLLIARIFGAVLFVIFVFAGAKIANRMEPGAGLVLAALLATSPLYLHYFATPLPDLLSLACSAVAVMLLVDSGHRARFWLVVSLLVISAFIKPPVTFVFIAFYVTWTLVNWRSTLSGQRSSWIRLGGLLAASLAGVIISEFIRHSYRCAVIGCNMPSRWEWYFGLLTDRTSRATWSTVWNYTQQAFAFRWLTYVAVIALVLYLVLGRFEGFKLLLPPIVGFASGWLVFTKLFVWHDYYGLPTMFMLFMGISIAVGGLAGVVAQRVDSLSKPAQLLMAPLLIVVAVPLMIVYGHKISSYGVTSEGQAMRFILRDVEHFVFVSNEDPYNPEVGGQAAKPFTVFSQGEFERYCMEILRDERAVVINRLNVEESPSQCLSMIRESANSFMRGPLYEVFSWSAINEDLRPRGSLGLGVTARP